VSRSENKINRFGIKACPAIPATPSADRAQQNNSVLDQPGSGHWETLVQYSINQAIFDCLGSTHEIIAIGIDGDLLDRLVGMSG
jgi:hypothetical protein